MRQLQEARQLAELRIGRQLSEAEYESALQYATRKAELQGNGSDYVPLLLPDVIAERELESASIAIAAMQYQCRKEVLDRWKRLLGISESQLFLLAQKSPEILRSVAAVIMP